MSGRQPPPDVPLGPLNDDFKFFLANMPFNVTCNDIRRHFTQFGPVNFCKVIHDKATNKSRGFGFLYMQTMQGNLAVENYSLAHNQRIQFMNKAHVFLARHDVKREMPIRNPNLLRTQQRQEAGGGARSTTQQHGSYGSGASSGHTATYSNTSYPPQPQHLGVHGPASQSATTGVTTAYPPSANYGYVNSQSTAAFPPQQPTTLPPQGGQSVAYAPAQPSAVNYGQAAPAPVPYNTVAASAPAVPAAPQQPGIPYVTQPQQQTTAFASQGTVYGQYPAEATVVSQGGYAAAPVPQKPQQPPVAYQQTVQSYTTPQQAVPTTATTSYTAAAVVPPPPQAVPQRNAPPPPPPPRTKVLLENLPTNATPGDIVQSLAKQHSVTVKTCALEYDTDPKATWCYAHVDLATPADAFRILDLAKRSFLQYRGRILHASRDQGPGTVTFSQSSTARHASDPRRSRGGKASGGGRRGRHNRSARRNRPY